MKKIAGILLTLLLSASILLAMPICANAESSAVQDGLEVNILTDKDIYSSDEEISLSISIKNTNTYAVDGVSIKTLLPEGLNIKAGELDFDNISISPGDTYKTTITTVENTSSKPGDTSSKPGDTSSKPGDTSSKSGDTSSKSGDISSKPGDTSSKTDDTSSKADDTSSKADDTSSKADDTSSKADDTKNNTEDTTAEPEGPSKPDTSSKPDKDDKIQSPITGDDSKMALVILLFAVALVALILSIKFKKIKKTISLFLCIAIVLTMIPMGAFAFDFNSGVETSKTILVDGQEFVIKAKAEWSNSEIQAPIIDDTTFTRGEWLGLLADKVGIVADTTIPESDYFYGDSIDSDIGQLVETFYYFNLLPAPDSEGYDDPEQDIPLFEPNKVLTREYAAYTVAKAMGFDGDVELTCNDANNITYKNEVAILLQQGYLLLDESNNFNPAEPFDGTDKIRVFSRIDTYNDSLTIEEDEIKDEVSVQSDVVDVQGENYVVTDNNDGTYTVVVSENSNVSSFVEGAVITITRDNETEIALKIKSVVQQDGDVVLTCEKPEIEEVVKEFDFVGYGVADVSQMTVSDGVTAEYDPNGSIVSGDDDDLEPFDLGGDNYSLPGTLKYRIDEKEIGDTGIKVSGNVEFEVPNITAIAKGRVLGGLSLDELTFSVTNKVKIIGELEYKFGVPENGFDTTTGNPTFGTGKNELGRIPVKLGATGLSLDFVLFLYFDVSGTVSISYTLETTSGFQYKDGAFRTIKDYRSEFETLKLNANAKVGFGLAPRISLFSVFDLAGCALHAGLGLNAKYMAHTDVDPTLHCGDATVYLYGTFELDTDTIIVDIVDRLLGLSWKWDFWDEDSSPFKLKLHLENGEKVESCTYGKGSIFGSIKSAETNEPIGGARIHVYNASTNVLVDTVQTQTVSLILSGLQLYKGEFLVQNLPVGQYRLEVLATGYKSYDIIVDVISDQRVVCEGALMLLREEMAGNGTVTGDIINALTGEPLTGTTYAVRNGWNNLSGEIIKSGDILDSSYSIELNAGNYTIEIGKDGFINAFVNVAIHTGNETTKNIPVSPTTGIEIDSSSFRAVLTWGEYPSDLDSHMYHINENQEVSFHTCYYDQDSYKDGILVANLDVDDVTSYGPETSTVYKMEENGIYSFYVHDFTNRESDNSLQMSNSNAQVKLYSGEILIATFNIPQNREGTLWHVFDYNAANDQFDYVNEFSYSVEG